MKKKIDKQILISLLALILFIFFPSCKKYLDKKPEADLIIPTRVSDLQALLDESVKVNQVDPTIGERSADDYYLTYADWASLTEQERNVYTWEKENLLVISPANDWSNCYNIVYKANIVLDYIDKVNRDPGEELAWKNAKGHAYFIRAKGFWNAVTLFALAYNEQTAATDPGIALRLTSDFIPVSVRSTVKESYDQIIADLRESAKYLPVSPTHVMRPSLPAAYGMLARTYLCMRQYDSAMRYADLCLQLRNNLLDYNTVNASLTLPFAPRFSHPEIIFESLIPASTAIAAAKAKIDSSLYQSYAANDLRKTIFFQNNNNGSYAMKGNYTGTSSGLFTGIATDEMYLIRSECRARAGNLQGALSDLNALLSKRWKNGFFQPLTANTAAEALVKILIERRKELLFRGLRWIDIKRLNLEGANITLTRKLNNQTFTLTPNHPRFALPIPDDVIQLTGMPQNPR